ncbi:DUF6665 family protein [Sphingomonas crocodyli]|uniref:DUF6665 family protein n=1 Tax=Sphingomonas crocodyli TaxID=1979270 RepID=UPI003B831594
MSLRLPQNLETAFPSDRALNAFHGEVLAEKAASLGRAGKLLASKLALLAKAAPGEDRKSLLQDAADAAHGYFIQRELCGLCTHQTIVKDYKIPREVLARIGRGRPSSRHFYEPTVSNRSETCREIR